MQIKNARELMKLIPEKTDCEAINSIKSIISTDKILEIRFNISKVSLIIVTIDHGIINFRKADYKIILSIDNEDNFLNELKKSIYIIDELPLTKRIAKNEPRDSKSAIKITHNKYLCSVCCDAPARWDICGNVYCNDCVIF